MFKRVYHWPVFSSWQETWKALEPDVKNIGLKSVTTGSKAFAKKVYFRLGIRVKGGKVLDIHKISNYTPNQPSTILTAEY